MPRSGTVHLTIERNGDADHGLSLTAFSSSIIRCTTFVSDKSDLGITDPDELYTLISNPTRYKEVVSYSGNERAHSKTFVTVEGEGKDHTHGKTTSIQISATYDEDDWYFENSDEKLNLYLYITYDVQLVECYMDENAGGSLSLEDNSVFFENDLKRITVSYDKNN